MKKQIIGNRSWISHNSLSGGVTRPYGGLGVDTMVRIRTLRPIDFRSESVQLEGVTDLEFILPANEQGQIKLSAVPTTPLWESWVMLYSYPANCKSRPAFLPFAKTFVSAAWPIGDTNIVIPVGTWFGTGGANSFVSFMPMVEVVQVTLWRGTTNSLVTAVKSDDIRSFEFLDSAATPIHQVINPGVMGGAPLQGLTWQTASEKSGLLVSSDGALKVYGVANAGAQTYIHGTVVFKQA